MPVLLAVALGGAVGSLARYGADRLIERRISSVFPWSTFTINATGCLLIGVLVAAVLDRHHTPAWIRAGLAMGVLGGYTTFSTLAQKAFL
jgi:fluoride exporter